MMVPQITGMVSPLPDEKLDATYDSSITRYGRESGSDLVSAPS